VTRLTKTLALVVAVTATFAVTSASQAATSASHTPRPIKHFITVMQENHTYDNYFGKYPHGDGLPAKVCVPLNPRRPHQGCVHPFHLGSNRVVPANPANTTKIARQQFNYGQMNGFVRALDRVNQDGRLAVGYRNGRDLPYYWNLAGQYVLYDRFFSSAMADDFINNLYWVTGGPAGEPPVPTGAELGRALPVGGTHRLTTIFDRLDAAGVSWKFYVQNYNPKLTYRTFRRFAGNRASQVMRVPLLSMPRYLNSAKLFSHIVPISQYYGDLLNNKLPAVSYIVPSGPTEHPPSSVSSGQAFIRSLINSLIQSPAWKSSAFLLSYDEWGGWYDHVKPPQIDKYGYGFRVPALLVSPYAKRGFVDHTQLDYTSILRFIEQNWKLRPLTSRDAHANSIATGFDFAQTPRPAVLTASTRSNSPLETKVRRPVIYALYGGALAVPLVLIAFALLTGRRRAEPILEDARGEYG
jgi:phospholipase C